MINISEIQFCEKEIEKIIQHEIENEKNDLSDIRESIVEFLLETEKFNDDECMNLAFDIVDQIIYDLEINYINLNRLLKYISEMNCYEAYLRLIEDYKDMLEPKKYHEIKQEANHFFPDMIY